VAVSLFQIAAFSSGGPKDAVLSLLVHWHVFFWMKLSFAVL